MPGILRSEAFAGEDVAQVAAAVVANNFYPSAVGVRDPFHSTGDFIIEGGPATSGVELVFRTVERGFTTAADVGTFGKVLVIFTGERIFRTLFSIT